MRKLSVLLLLLAAGCSRTRDQGMPVSSVVENGEERIMLLAIGSDEEPAIEFASKLIERYARDAPQDKLVIARLGDPQFLVWEGRVLDLKKLCPSKQELRALLTRKQPSQSVKLYASLRDSLRYALADPRVEAGRAKPLVFVLSAMKDNGSTYEDKANLSFHIGEIGWKRGEMRLYFVDPSSVEFCRDWLSQMRVQKSAVYSSGQPQPPIPSL